MGSSGCPRQSERAGGERTAQARHVRLDDLGRSGGRGVPQQRGQLVDAQGRRCTQQQQGEDLSRALRSSPPTGPSSPTTSTGPRTRIRTRRGYVTPCRTTSRTQPDHNRPAPAWRHDRHPNPDPHLRFVTGLNHAAIVTADLERLVSFYVDVFGAETIDVPAPPGTRATTVRLSETSGLALMEIPGNPPHTEGSTVMLGRGHLDHIALDAPTASALEEVRRRLVAPGGRATARSATTDRC